MKSAIAAIALSVASVAYSHSITELPDCAVSCFVNVLSNDGCSSLSDYECHCNKAGLVDSVAPCVEQACSAADEETVIKDVVALCQDYGVQLTIPVSKAITAPGYSVPTFSPATPVNNNPATTTTNPAVPVVVVPSASAPVVSGNSGAVPSNSSELIATIPIVSSPVVVASGGSTGGLSSLTSRPTRGYPTPTPYKGTPTSSGVLQFTGAAAPAARGVGAAVGVAAAFVAAVF